MRSTTSDEVFTGRVRVARVEAEADLEVRLRLVDRIPEPREVLDAFRDGVLPARRVLDVERDRLDSSVLERPDPPSETFVDVVFGVSAVDDDRLRLDQPPPLHTSA